MQLALSVLCNRRVWYWEAFYDPQFGWFRFGAGYWIRHVLRK